jgi:protein-S-isoprenylcysteine O-methyltransferase Ste14
MMNSSLNQEITQSAPNVSIDSPGVLVFPPVLLLGPMLLSVLINLIWPLHFPPTMWIKAAGGLLFMMGVFLAGWGRLTMVRAGTNVPPHKPTLTIVTNGPFRFTRNPLYLGGTVAYIGLSLGLNLAWAPILLVPMLFLLNWGIVSREERYLEKKFGETYRVYRARVPRWL